MSHQHAGYSLSTDLLLDVLVRSWDEIACALADLENGVVGFVILNHCDGSYVQCTGPKWETAVEFRSCWSGGFTHSVIGRPEPSVCETAIRAKHGLVHVRSNEVLTTVDARLIFESFFQHLSIPRQYLLRDISHNFTE